MRKALAIWVVLAACGDDATVTLDAMSIDAAVSDAAIAELCPAGTKLLADRTSCPASPVVPPEALLATVAAPGDIVSLHGLAEGTLPCAPTAVCVPDGAATLMFSDDPETPSASGVLYADTVGPGRVRVYVYHVNGSAAARKFSVVALAQTAVTATIRKEAVGTPGGDYVAIGKQVARAWLSSDVVRVVSLPAGERVLLSPLLDTTHASTNQLVHAIFDVDLDGPVKLSVVSVLVTDDAVAVTAGLPLLPYDGAHDRGTFPNADLVLAVRAGGEGPSARHVRLGSNVTDDDLPGRDATRSANTTLRGNYGVSYRFSATTPDPLQLAASARGGIWAGALEVGGSVLPLGPLEGTASALWLGTDPRVQLISGGGSSLPVDIVVLSH